jgi:hypothetical protein
VVQNADSGFEESANEFVSALHNFDGPSLSEEQLYINAQYYWAQPYIYTSDKNNYVNSVNFALTEAHGNWGVFSTNGMNGGNVFLSQIGAAGGYGSSAGGVLAYWIIHACEVIPSQADESNSFDIWWPIFQGIRAVVGYRTEAIINDGVPPACSIGLAAGSPVVSSWLIASMDDGANEDAGTYFDSNVNIYEPYGRASTVSVCDHTDDTAFDLTNIGPAGCLWEHWFYN